MGTAEHMYVCFEIVRDFCALHTLVYLVIESWIATAAWFEISCTGNMAWQDKNVLCSLWKTLSKAWTQKAKKWWQALSDVWLWPVIRHGLANLQNWSKIKTEDCPKALSTSLIHNDTKPFWFKYGPRTGMASSQKPSRSERSAGDSKASSHDTPESIRRPASDWARGRETASQRWYKSLPSTALLSWVQDVLCPFRKAWVLTGQGNQAKVIYALAVSSLHPLPLQLQTLLHVQPGSDFFAPLSCNTNHMLNWGWERNATAKSMELSSGDSFVTWFATWLKLGIQKGATAHGQS